MLPAPVFPDLWGCRSPGRPAVRKEGSTCLQKIAGNWRPTWCCRCWPCGAWVFFPGMMLQFEVARKKSVLAVSEAICQGQADLPGDPGGPVGGRAGGGRPVQDRGHRPGKTGAQPLRRGHQAPRGGPVPGGDHLPGPGGPLSFGERGQVPGAHLQKDLTGPRRCCALSTRSSTSTCGCSSMCPRTSSWECCRRRTAAAWRTT